MVAAMSLSFVTPGFAYVAEGTRTEHQSRRLVDSAARGANDISAGLTRTMRTRKPAEAQENGLTKLRRASGQHNRNANRKPKEGSDRYRTLHPNTRSLRRDAEGIESMLPGRLVQTGGLYDRPTRRDITGSLEMLH
ncbi:hypothetical protein A3C37_03260 [Candidatus Peribacteria bacterium RIFCSPHIGHO2_02_FULL_53_20]|nr:MAG: hypothetical protein A3C37_03260 [Candidatus Peribacteria bacterium RIFCSPHIGHO2_02_FULL_53_20]OGJ67409.1 MAG: hypothetical protein A3B61_00570 [Candidatus Peribacteria bacterium RIFCSPLOWO2_01_FULL_53_10]OGJ72613.1 MAG: hypothetical protein A3G69_01695 [Candidatus Peribacteria bacterium RIFCSPLOWO2_12_FULL_53_10]